MQIQKWSFGISGTSPAQPQSRRINTIDHAPKARTANTQKAVQISRCRPKCLNNSSLPNARKRRHEIPLTAKQNQISHKGSTTSTHRNTNNPSAQLSAKSNTNIIQKVHQGLTDLLARPKFTSFCVFRSKESLSFVTGNTRRTLPSKSPLN